MKPQSSGGVCEAVLMPHAPVLIPEVGGGREREAGSTVDALWLASGKVVAARPDAVVLISPHSPRRPGCFGIWSGKWLAGDMSQFGRSDTRLKLPNATNLSAALRQHLSERGIEAWSISATALDHGAFVPLYFLTRSGWEGPTLVLSLNYPGEGGWSEVGESIRSAAEELGLRVAVIASGDMSHRLMPGAPGGYEPQARHFDEEFVKLVRSGTYDAMERMDPGLQELAGEDVVDSTLIAAHAVGLRSNGHTLFSYEGPFGVGYCVARLFHANGDHPAPSVLPSIAREAVESRFDRKGDGVTVPSQVSYQGPAAVFVTIRTLDGHLRGCRGTLVPTCKNVVEETRTMALSSAFQDLRFDPVEEDELDDLTYEVSVLNAPEPVASKSDLDPHRYGIIVATADGRRGVMLPNVEGLDTVDEQIRATCRKAGIDPKEEVILQRFTTDKYVEA